MPNLKVKPLEWYMMDQEELVEMGYPEYDEDVTPIGRNGYYCLGDLVWIELDGKTFNPCPRQTPQRAREYFQYTITVNDEAILPAREVVAMRQILNISRDASVKKTLNKRIRLHEQAFELRQTRRNAMKIEYLTKKQMSSTI